MLYSALHDLRNYIYRFTSISLGTPDAAGHTQEEGWLEEDARKVGLGVCGAFVFGIFIWLCTTDTDNTTQHRKGKKSNGCCWLLCAKQKQCYGVGNMCGSQFSSSGIDTALYRFLPHSLGGVERVIYY